MACVPTSWTIRQRCNPAGTQKRCNLAGTHERCNPTGTHKRCDPAGTHKRWHMLLARVVRSLWHGMRGQSPHQLDACWGKCAWTCSGQGMCAAASPYLQDVLGEHLLKEGVVQVQNLQPPDGQFWQRNTLRSDRCRHAPMHLCTGVLHAHAPKSGVVGSQPASKQHVRSHLQNIPRSKRTCKFARTFSYTYLCVCVRMRA